eukprot:GDKH01007813.1.p2 GENE.GDKH01007813.1~~GDKH01007813.1.p2  ORF type:complete len:70 (-),score=23.43 GDKH01007813.1:128-337(-)
MDVLDEQLIHPLHCFYRNSKTLLQSCVKPDGKEYYNSLIAIGGGFLVMGFIGYFVKLFFIPINNSILGA